MYSAEISRKNPGCFIFLLDQSASMEDPFGGSSDRRKADELATIINKLLHNLSIRCAKGDSIYDYFHVAVIGYGQDTVVKSAFDGPMTGKDLVPISDLANNPLRIEDRVKKTDDGNGGLVEQTVKFPLWFEAKHAGGTPMSSAFKMAADLVQRWFAKQLFEMSSNLTPFMISRAKELGMPADEGARGFVFNAQPVQVIQFLDIGTRPANLR